jgi:hypothetical protein
MFGYFLNELDPASADRLSNDSAWLSGCRVCPCPDDHSSLAVAFHMANVNKAYGYLGSYGASHTPLSFTEDLIRCETTQFKKS